MLCNPYSKKLGALPSPQVEQRSHAPLGLAPRDSDIAQTLFQISDSKPKVAYANTSSDEEKRKFVADFVNARPKSMVIIDGEKHSEESIICALDERGNKTCLRLMFSRVELFRQMQKLKYCCSLLNDIDATYFKCRKIM